MKLLCIDETGDHSLGIIDRSYPIFVLVGVVVDRDYHDTTLTNMLDQLKTHHFGTDTIILHNQEATHPQTARNPAYLKFLDVDFRRRFYRDVGQLLQKADERGQIVAESRNGVLDNQLEIAYLANRVEGTSKVRPAELKLKLESSIQFMQKSDNTAGIQLADLVASPIARHFLGKPERRGQQISYADVFAKVRSINGRWENIGITVLPQHR